MAHAMSTLSPPVHAVPSLAGDTPGRDELRDLMEMVNETARRLHDTHAALQTEVVRLKGELAEANSQLKRSRSLAALGEMAAGIAHEVRNPLASIELYAQMLEEDLCDLPEPRGLCVKIRRAVAGLDGIVRDVLLFARETRVRAEPVDLRDLIEAVCAQCEGIVTRHEVLVQTSMHPDVPDTVIADPGLLVQACANVMRNAVEAMVEARTAAPRLELYVDVRRMRLPEGGRRRRVVIAIRDHGPGVPDTVVERMFNPFFTTRATGTGLGLAIVHRIIDAHGGHIAVSNAQSGGALVELCLPEAPSRAVAGRKEHRPGDRDVQTPCMEAKDHS